MSEPTKKSIEGIPTDAVIDLQISGNFYQRLHQLLMFHSQKEGLDKFTAALAAIKAGEPKNEYEYHLLTILTLIGSIEEAAKIQGKIKTADLPEQPLT
jgi:hypothetical protein